MKTTVEIPDRLFREAKAYAATHGISLREVIEAGLRELLEGRSSGGGRFRLKTVTTKGEGLACDSDWNTIRSLIYEGQGG
jgi:Bacterial antitoxin of type II TA system, VapB